MLVNAIIIFLVALIFAEYFIRKIIYISHQKGLFDEPSESRKIHVARTPNLGGIAIFASMMFTSCIILSFTTIPFITYIIFCSLLLFITGLTDDLVGMNPLKKVGVQIVIALILTLFTNVRITSFYGLFNVFELPFGVSVLVSVIFVIYVINAINLIDGINCLAAGVGLLACLIFSFYFYQMGEKGFMLLAIAMCGCLAGFLYYNRTPAKIFMGDTGSLFLGFFIAILGNRFLESINSLQGETNVPFMSPGPGILFGLLIIPLYDTFRVFVLRIVKGGSPFVADRNHIHHMLLDLNLSHLQATFVLISMNVASLMLVFLLQDFGPEIIILSSITLMCALNIIFSVLLRKRKTEQRPAYELPKNIRLKIVRERESAL